MLQFDRFNSVELAAGRFAPVWEAALVSPRPGWCLVVTPVRRDTSRPLLPGLYCPLQLPHRSRRAMAALGRSTL